jgi:hypothetical protein
MSQKSEISRPWRVLSVDLMSTRLVLWATLSWGLFASPNGRSEPRNVNSLVASAVVSGHTTSFTRTQFEKVLGPEANPDDKTLALAGFILAANLDRLLLEADKFESVPSYRLTHALKALIAANRLHPSEEDADVYARLVDSWKNSCAPRIAAGRACDFVFRFEKSDWERGQPDFSARVSLKDLNHVTREFISSYYRPSIHDMAQKAHATGRDSVRVAGETYTLTKNPGETLASLIARSTELWKRIYLDLNFFFVSEDNARLHFKSSEPVIFRRFQVAREIREHEWDGFAFRLSKAPARYEDFIDELRKHLDTIYLERTRKVMMDGLVASKTNLAMGIVSSSELQKHAALQPARARKGRFAILSLPLSSEANEAELTAASRYIVATLSTASAHHAAALFPQIASEIAQRFGLAAQTDEIDFESRASSALSLPSDARDLQMHQLLFPDASNLSGSTTMHYFVDQARARLSFTVVLDMSPETRTALDPGKDPKVDVAKLENEILQNRFALIYRELILRTLSEASVRLLDSEYLPNPRLASMDERRAAEELKRVVLLSVESLEKQQPGSGWQRLMKQVFSAPLKPRDLQAPKMQTAPRRGLSRLLNR